MHLLFVGSGYVGLVSGVMLASTGLRVTCIDSDKNKIELLRNGKLPIYEPGLEEYVSSSQKNGNLDFISDYSELQSVPYAVFITVGTPSLESGDADLSCVYDASLLAAKNLPETTLIVIKSTVPPGTTSAVQNFLKAKGYSHQLVSNPEFLREGKAIADFMNPDRVVIGLWDEKSREVIQKIYKDFSPLFFTDPTTAELIKYASNSFLATKIAFINEMANICEKTGGDVDALAIAMGMDKRIAPDFLKVGPGFGGSCFPKDILALEFLARKCGEPFHVLSAVIEANEKRRGHIVDKIEAQMGGIKGKAIGVLGLAFKADTDDIRSSPAIDIVNLLIARGANVKAYDPEAMDNTKQLGIRLDFAINAEDVFSVSDAVVILTEWKEFKELDYKALGAKMKEKIIFDFRNILDRDLLEKQGFKIFQLGKKHESYNL
jgi:UDPglucose 6-dehydrogenase